MTHFGHLRLGIASYLILLLKMHGLKRKQYVGVHKVLDLAIQLEGLKECANKGRCSHSCSSGPRHPLFQESNLFCSRT